MKKRKESSLRIPIHVCVCVCVRERERESVCMLSRVQFFLTSWTVARQALLSMELSRQEFWSGLPFPSPEDLPNPGTEPKSPVSPALGGRFFSTAPPGKPAHNMGRSQSLSVSPGSSTH